MSYRFAIIGCGHIAQRHAQCIASIGHLAAVCDVDSARAQALASKYGALAFTEVSEMLESQKPDIVAVCSPNGWHAPHAIECLQSGSHVLCEKPLSINVADGMQMILAAKDANRKLLVVKQNRFNPPVLAIRKMLEEKSLGPIHSFEINCFWNRPAAYYRGGWKGSLELDGGTLFTQFSHFIDLLYWFLGDLKSCSGKRANFQHKRMIEFEDTGAALLEMENGAMGTLNYTINSSGKNMEGSITLFGEKGTVKIGGQYLNELDYFQVEGIEAPVLAASKPANDYGFYQGSMSNHEKVYEQLVEAINNRQHTLVEATEALKTVDMVEKIYQSSPLRSFYL